MKLNTLAANLVTIFHQPASEFTELLRALKEGSSHFRERTSDADQPLDAGILVSRPGPGGGLDADPFRASFLLLAFLLGAKRAEVAQTTWEAWHICPVGTVGTVDAGWADGPAPKLVCCSITQQPLFGDAFRAILADADLAARVRKITIDCSGTWAEITPRDGEASRFGRPDDDKSDFGRVAWISGHALFSIALLLNR
jgi:hypothetical protein